MSLLRNFKNKGKKGKKKLSQTQQKAQLLNERLEAPGAGFAGAKPGTKKEKRKMAVKKHKLKKSKKK